MFINIPKDASKGQMVPAGIYKATVSQTKIGTSQNGNPKISVGFTINSQGPDESVKTVGRMVWDTWTVTEDVLSMWAGKYKTLAGDELPAGQYSLDEFMNLVTSNIQNKEGLVQVTMSADGTRNNVSSISAIQ